ncbi:MAG: fibronectin type III domain-containing protein, partial [Gammaproteobacteria bacterium]
GCRARSWRRAAAALLAAALLGAMGGARAQSVFASFGVTDPHGNPLTLSAFSIPGVDPSFTAKTRTVNPSPYTFPYIIVTVTPADPHAILGYAFNGVVTTTPFVAAERLKIRLLTGTMDIYVNETIARTLSIRRTSGGIPDDPVLAEPAHAATSLTISWSPPTNTNGANITGYKIRWAAETAPAAYLNTGGAEGMDVSGGASAATHAITNLTTGTAYRAEVAAVNSHGTGGWADAQTATPADPVTPGAPSAPRMLAVSNANTKLHLRWDAPQDAGDTAITKYRVRWAEGAHSTAWLGAAAAAGQEIPGDANARTYTLTTLTNGTTYAVQVAAENSRGTGAWSASKRGTPMPSPPAMPHSVNSTVYDRTLMVFWEAPADDGGAALTDYKVRWRRSSTETWVNPPGAAGAFAGIGDRSHTISRLLNGTAYVVQVAAVNSLGTGAWSASHQNTPKAVPRMPRNLVVTGGGGRLNLDWSAPAGASGSAVSEYAVRWAEGAGAISWLIPPGASGRATTSTATTYTLRGLKSATTYEVQIAARNATGLSAWTASAQGETASFDLDVNQSGAVDWMDGVMIARHLLGLRGAALVAGLGSPLANAANVSAHINAGRLDGVLDVDDSQTTTAADGIMIARYLLGVRGDALTDAQSNTTSADVIMNIEAL